MPQGDVLMSVRVVCRLLAFPLTAQTQRLGSYATASQHFAYICFGLNASDIYMLRVAFD